MAKTFYEDDINALKKAIEYCKKGNCESAIPYILQRLHFCMENDFEMSNVWNFA